MGLMTIILAILFLLAVVLAMGFKAIFVKNGKFPSSHVCQHDFDNLSQARGSIRQNTKKKD